jgi:hypothetical protein
LNIGDFISQIGGVFSFTYGIVKLSLIFFARYLYYANIINALFRIKINPKDKSFTESAAGIAFEKLKTTNKTLTDYN